MLNNLSLRKKILLLIGETITVLLIIASTFFVKYIADLSRVNIEREAPSYQIATSTEEQTVVSEDINTSLSAINNLVNSTADHAYTLADEAPDLSDLATALNKTVNQFKL